ncbi:MAG: isoprenylcysteine carboxylmethyltransferase family protein [Gemmatimonadales bacterium]|nr:isoprenylcysteine carboxylmethyltransferase family protein [Gemmatimonadales bacterium]
MTRPIIVLVLLAVYVGLAFGLRTYLQFRRTGSSGFRGISGRPFSAAWLGGVLFALALFASIAAPFLALTSVDAPLVPSSWPVDIAGAGAFAGGTLFLLWSQGAMGTSWRIGVDASEVTGLVTAGPFAWVRNPIFSGMMLSAAGFVLLLPTRLAVASYAMLVLAIELQVRFVEEPYLERTHGETYHRYRAAVGRFIPGLGRP